MRRLEKVLSGLGATPGGKPCKAMAGLIAEANETLDDDADPDVLDAALIAAAKKSSATKSPAAAACARSVVCCTMTMQ